MLHTLKETFAMSLVFWAVGAFALLLVVSRQPGTSAFPAPAGEYQAVFLSNDQVYFGKLADHDAAYVTLADVYYLRTARDLEDQGGGLNLIKLGGEVHGPESTIFIPKSSILFWENLKDSSRIVQTIRAGR